MTDDQAELLLRQVIEMYRAFGRGVPYGSEEFAMLTNGLFEIADAIAPDEMHAAFR